MPHIRHDHDAPIEYYLAVEEAQQEQRVQRDTRIYRVPDLIHYLECMQVQGAPGFSLESYTE